MLTLKILFWAMLLIIFYTYIGYGILLYIIIRLKRFFTGKSREAVSPTDDELPTMTLMICAYNEEDIVAEKMQNTLALDYPSEGLVLGKLLDRTGRVRMADSTILGCSAGCAGRAFPV